jgi:putative DNA primase/helicase
MKAVAGINAIKLAETVTSRSIVFELRRKRNEEHVTRLRHAEAGLFDDLAAKLARFADDFASDVQKARPHLPDELGDRDQDNWEPLLQIAGVAGGHWPDTAIKAALKLSGASSSTQSTGNELLADIQAIFETNKTIKISTAELIKALCEDEEASWATYNRGKALTPRQLSTRLSTYGISSKTIRINAYETAKGFEVEQFYDAFARYLSDPPNLPSQSNNTLEANNGGLSNVTDIKNVTVTEKQEVTPRPALNKACDVVTDKTPILGDIQNTRSNDDVMVF